MQDTRVAAVSMNGFMGVPEQVLDSIDDWCGQAAEEKADLVVFPELVIHGHCTPNTWEVAETVPEGASVKQLELLAEKHGLVISAGLSEKERDIVYNTQVLVGPSGYIGKQRKIHLSRDEVLYYKGGRDMNVFNIGKCKVGTSICYDNQFPEVCRILALCGADVLLMPHAARESMWDDTPESEAAARRQVFEYFRHTYPMRARENACFCVYADQAGRAGIVDIYPPDHPNQPHHPGGAMIFGPDGDLLKATQTKQIKDEMIVHVLEAKELARQRSHPNYTLRTRRPELFGELVREQTSS